MDIQIGDVFRRNETNREFTVKEIDRTSNLHIWHNGIWKNTEAVLTNSEPHATYTRISRKQLSWEDK